MKWIYNVVGVTTTTTTTQKKQTNTIRQECVFRFVYYFLSANTRVLKTNHSKYTEGEFVL